MKARFLTTLLIASMLFTAPAIARETVPIINYDNVAVASGKAAQTEQIRQAIQTAAVAKGWSIAHQGDGKILATLNVRNKHTVMVEISCSANRYSLHYKDSTNMKFGEREGQPVIHPYYNKWVRELQETIRLELLKA